MGRAFRVCTWLALAALSVACAVNPVPTPATGGSGGTTANVGGGGGAQDSGAFNTGADAGTTAGGGMDLLSPAMDLGAAPEATEGTDSAAADATTSADAANDNTAPLPDAATPVDAQPDPGPGSDAGPDLGPAPDTAAIESLPPTEPKALTDWLVAGHYKGWKAESKVHNSTGPHFGGVKTFVSAKMLESLVQGNATHPVDAAAVKELYGSGSTVLGWSVMRKTKAGTGGDTWWWYEDYGGKVYAAGQGAGLCTGCHSPGKDYFLSPFPLQ